MKKKVIIFVIGILLSSIGGGLYYKFIFYNQNNAKIIGEYVLEAIDEGDYEVGEYYYLTDMKKKAISKDEYKIIKVIENTPYVYVFVLEKDIVLIAKEAIFQGISGYLVTTREEMPEFYPVPQKLGFDGNKIQISKISNELYAWNAGL